MVRPTKVFLLLTTAAALAACGAPATSLPAQPSARPSPSATFTATATSSASPTARPRPTETPTPACTETAGRLEQAAYPGAVVEGPVPVLIYLPACYGVEPAAYPLLVLLHGKPFDETQWLDLGAVALADAGIEGGWPPFVMAMPRQPEPLFSGTDGGPGSYETELTEGLLPYLEAAYRLRSEAEGRSLLGLSRGGVWALEVGLRRPDLFSQVAALSPALAVNHPRPAYDPFALAAGDGPLPARVHLSAGEADWARPETERLAEALRDAGVKEVEMLLVPGDHSRDTWLLALPQALAFLVEGWEKAAPAR